MADAIIELVGPEDLPVILKLYNQIFRPGRDLESFHRRYRGRYNVLQLVARLGDESRGETLALRASAQALTLVARFDPEDHTTERGTRVDFNGRRPVENPTLFAGTLKRFLEQ